MDNRSISKRIHSRALKENELANEPSKAKKKIKITEEETDSQSSQSSILSSLSLESSASASQSSTTTSKLWSNWNTFVKLFISSSYEDLDVNEYSLEFLGIITLGNNIGNRQTRSKYPKDLVASANELIKLEQQDVFSKYESSLYESLFSALKTSADSCHKLLLKKSLAIEATNDLSLSFCHKFFLTYVKQIFVKRGLERVARSESAYSFRVVWNFMDIVADSLPCSEFLPGETRLQAITDNGTNLVSEAMQAACSRLGIKKVQTSVEHPQSDGLVERMNRTMKTALSIYCEGHPHLWDQYLPFITFSINTSKQKSTGYSPFEAMFGRKARLPAIDVFIINAPKTYSTEAWLA